ncbi:MAG: low specificity L-threonine aldolase [Actinobacteria bacterium]|nr:low specificity L-threonine aldolase [Actinomycetota bacterium]
MNDTAASQAVSTDLAAHPRGFASDNYAGAHPEVLAAVAAANIGHASSYGADPWTARFTDIARELFGPDTEAFPVFNGTGANVLSLQAALPRWGAVVCAKSAHINVDEGGAPEKVAGLKLLPVPTTDGKLTPELVDLEAWGWGDEHRAQPLAVSISQSTEFGTCYTPDEIRALADHAHEHGMVLHMDGSRLSNAAAYLGASLAEITTEAGVDVLSLGGTKNGLLGAEAVLALNPAAVPGLTYLRKTNMQLGSKMRFVSAQLAALYEDGLWLRSASHANAMAARLRAGIEALIADGRGEGVTLPFATQSNVVFPTLPAETKARAHAAFHFYDWPGDATLVRLMCSFDTTEQDVDDLLAVLAVE